VLFNHFIDDQVAWINSQKVAAKRSGVLVPYAKFPSFSERMEVVVKGIRSQNVDTTYHKLTFAMFHYLDEIAKQDDKYADVVYMENYWYYWKVFSARSTPVPAIAPSVVTAESKYQEHMNHYLKWNVDYEMVDYGKFFDKLEAQLKQTAAEDVQFTGELSRHDLRSLIKNKLSIKEIMRHVDNMFKRINKHLTKKPSLDYFGLGKTFELLHSEV